MSPDSPNPYATPPGMPDKNPLPYQAMATVPSTVSQVLVVSIFQIVEGCLELLACAVVFVYGGIFGAIGLGVFPDGPDGQEAPVEFFGIISIGVILFGLLILTAAILRIWAGIAGLRFKRRTLGIAASVLGIATVFTFYCSMFSIAILVYSLIIYLDNNVKRAYEMAAQGMSPDEIRNPENWR